GPGRDGVDLGDLGLALLDPILAERPEPRRDRLADPLGRDGLGDRNDLDAARVTPGASRGAGNPLEDRGPRGSDFSHVTETRPTAPSRSARRMARRSRAAEASAPQGA